NQPRTGNAVGNVLVTETFLLRFGLELVADAESRLDERVARRVAVDLLAEATHEHVDRSVTVCLAPSPHLLEQLVAGDDAAAVERERVQELELGRRQVGAAAVDERLHLARVDAKLFDLDRIAATLFRGPDAPPRGRADAGDKLAHRERLHEVVVR